MEDNFHESGLRRRIVFHFHYSLGLLLRFISPSHITKLAPASLCLVCSCGVGVLYTLLVGAVVLALTLPWKSVLDFRRRRWYFFSFHGVIALLRARSDDTPRVLTLGLSGSATRK